MIRAMRESYGDVKSFTCAPRRDIMGGREDPDL